MKGKKLNKPACLITPVALSCACLLAAPSFAQSAYDDDYDDNGSIYGPEKGDWELIINGTGSNDQDFDAGAGAIEVQIGHYFAEFFVAGVRQSVGLAGVDEGDDTNWDVLGSTVGYANFVLDLDRFQPFGGVTFGYLYGEGVEDSFIAGPEAGLKFYALEDTFIFARAGYDFIFEDVDDADSSFDDGRFNYSIGIGFNF
jgi:hypothetical protein